MMQFLLCVVVLFTVAQAQEKESRVINTAQGPVRGYKDPEHDIFAFYGIPYATAPTGPHRYREPLPPPVWFQPLEAVGQDILCPQVDAMVLVDKKKQEDCLIANVFIPNTQENNLPVLVSVHGGGFHIGSGNMVSEKNLLKGKKMVIVNFNYRLGIHGFLCLGTRDAPGNAGMKDQVALLRWVQKNIANFGGNPNDVTIQGYSAGGASVDLLMLSPTTKGLFHKVIPESGANLATWSMQVDPMKIAKDFALSQNFTNVDDISALGEFYKTASYDILLSLPPVIRVDSSQLFAPCVERDLGVEMFLNENPLNILKSGKYPKVPILYGFANLEGFMRYELYETWVNKMKVKFSDFLPTDLKFENEEKKEAVAEEIKRFYFGDNIDDTKPDTLLKYLEYFSDVMFVYGYLEAVKLHVEAGHKNVYLYEYTFVDDATNIMPPSVYGANHCGQTVAVMDGYNMLNFTEIGISEEFKNVKEYMRKIWINFITTGNPVPEGSSLTRWPPATSALGPYMDLGRTMALKDKLAEERFFFWDKIYSKYYYMPKAPSAPNRHIELCKSN